VCPVRLAHAPHSCSVARTYPPDPTLSLVFMVRAQYEGDCKHLGAVPIVLSRPLTPPHAQDARPPPLIQQDEQDRWLADALAAVNRNAFCMRKAMVSEKEGGSIEKEKKKRRERCGRAAPAAPPCDVGS